MRLNRTLPHERHELRQKSLYVEPADSGLTRNRPKGQTKEEALKQIEGTSNDYNMALDRFTQRDVYRQEDLTFYNDLQVWMECPSMPNPFGRID